MALIRDLVCKTLEIITGNPAVPSITTDEADLETATTDDDLAFHLQLEEAIAASTSLSVPSPGVLFTNEFNVADFDLQFHDRKVAEEIAGIPDEEWQATGGNYQRPYAFGSTSASGGSDLGFYELFSLYFKGLVVEDEKTKAKFGAISVAIFDSRNGVVFQGAKALILPEAELRDEVAELEAFLMGLEFALSLALSSVSYFCVDFDVDHYLNANEKPKDAKVAELVNGAIRLKKRCLQCHSAYSSAATCKENADIVLQLARSLIVKQAGKPFKEIVFTKELTCNICLEDVDSDEMFEIGDCQHCFCYPCLQKHVELKVRERELPRCPQPECGIGLNFDTCIIFLPLELRDMLDQLVKEASTPAPDKLYCPNPRCSNLMSKVKALANVTSVASTSRLKVTACSRCVKCNSLFCINCKVLWNSNLSCDAYKKRKPDPSCSDAKFKRLVQNKKWRQCPRCSHIIELALGCNHIYCRCGHQLCVWKRMEEQESYLFLRIVVRREHHSSSSWCSEINVMESLIT